MAENAEVPSTKPYSDYVGKLAEFVGRVREAGIGGSRFPISHALNGQASGQLQSLVPLADRQLVGAFFTDSRLASRAIRPWRASISNDVKILDPACGAGDLLLSCARLLPVAEDWITTVEQWGRQLFGLDTSAEFVEAARLRLALLAASRTSHRGGLARRQPKGLFPNINVGNGLDPLVYRKEITHVVLNPPFGQRAAPRDCSWGSGCVSKAALFVDAVLGGVYAGTEVVAILPDVLRAGSRYSKWRRRVEALADIRSVRIYGPFDDSADVDVFIIRMRAADEPGQRRSLWLKTDLHYQSLRVFDRFELGVGPVVPHRHRNRGPWRPFATTRSLPPWQVTMSGSLKKRRFSGRTFEPPFVAVRRTSSPKDKHRAAAAIVQGSEPVAVENHLIVATPRDGTLKACRQLQKTLQQVETSTWLNDRIRCRHLTVLALAGLPLRQT